MHTLRNLLLFVSKVEINRTKTTQCDRVFNALPNRVKMIKKFYIWEDRASSRKLVKIGESGCIPLEKILAHCILGILSL